MIILVSTQNNTTVQKIFLHQKVLEEGSRAGTLCKEPCGRSTERLGSTQWRAEPMGVKAWGQKAMTDFTSIFECH